MVESKVWRLRLRCWSGPKSGDFGYVYFAPRKDFFPRSERESTKIAGLLARLQDEEPRPLFGTDQEQHAIFGLIDGLLQVGNRLDRGSSRLDDDHSAFQTCRDRLGCRRLRP